MTKTITVRYFARLREERGGSRDVLETETATPLELYAELRARYHFRLEPGLLKVAVNEAFCDWETPLNAGDEVVFIPPVAGG